MATNWSGGLQGAVGGGLAGSAFGPVGTAVGAGLGGLAGLFGGGGENPQQQAYRERLSELEHSYGGRARAPVERSGLSDFRGNQQGLVSQLELMAQGQGPSVAQANFEAATDRGTRQQQALASGATGPNAALAQFQAAQGAADLGSRNAQDLVTARMGEQQNAIGQLGQVLYGARGQDENNSQFNAAQGNNMTQFQRSLNDSSQLQALGLQGGQIASSAQQPSMGEQILAGGAGMQALWASQHPQGQGTGLQPIASGNPGAGGYFTPQAQQGNPNQQNPWWTSHGSPAGY